MQLAKFSIKFPTKFCLLAVALVGLGQTPTWGASQPTNAVIFNLTDFTTTPQSVRTLSLYPTGAPFTNGAGVIVTRDRITKATGTNGSVTVSNVYGGDYRSELAGTYTTTTNWYTFPVTNGVINAADWITAPTNPPSGGRSYTTTQADNLFLLKNGGVATNLSIGAWQDLAMRTGARIRFGTQYITNDPDSGAILFDDFSNGTAAGVNNGIYYGDGSGLSNVLASSSGSAALTNNETRVVTLVSNFVARTVQATNFIGPVDGLKGLPFPGAIHQIPNSGPGLAYCTYWDFAIPLNFECPTNTLTLSYITNTAIPALVANGVLRAWGSNQVIIFLDAGTVNPTRVNGAKVLRTDKWPGGYRNFSDQCHAAGFLAGVYNNLHGGVGPPSCAEPPETNYAQITATAQAMADGGIDWVKLDSADDPDLGRNLVRAWADACFRHAINLRAPTYCNAGSNYIHILATDFNYGQNWQSDPEFISHVNAFQNGQGEGGDTIAYALANFTNTLPRLWLTKYGCAASPDALITQWWATNTTKGYLTFDTMMQSYWQLQEPSPAAGHLLYLTNQEALAIQKDPGWLPCTNVAYFDGMRKGRIVKQLGYQGSGTNAIAFWSLDTTNYTFTVYATNFYLPAGSHFLLRDIWVSGGTTLGVYSNSFSYTLTGVSGGNTALLKASYIPMPYGHKFVELGQTYAADFQTNLIVSAGPGAGLQLIFRDAAQSLTLYARNNALYAYNGITGDEFFKLNMYSPFTMEVSGPIKLAGYAKASRPSSPAAGWMIYQTDNTPGLRVWNGTTGHWMKFTEATDD